MDMRIVFFKVEKNFGYSGKKIFVMIMELNIIVM